MRILIGMATVPRRSPGHDWVYDVNRGCCPPRIDGAEVCGRLLGAASGVAVATEERTAHLLSAERPEHESEPCAVASNGAEDEIRTRDPVLGKDVLYR